MSAAPISPLRAVAPVISVLVILTTPLAAQTGVGALSGTVVTARDGMPLPGAMIALDAGIRVLADEEGRFVIHDLREGPYRIAAIAPGCHAGLGEVDVVAGRTTALRLTVPLPDDVENRLAGWTLGSRTSGDATRVVTREDISRRHARTIQDAVRLVAPEMIGQSSATPGERQRLLSRRSATVAGGSHPLVVLDGVPLPQRSLEALSGINVEDVERIEVSKGAAGGWAYGNQGANGVIHVITRSAAASPLGPETSPERCNFTFPS
jgi:outer membrane receptor protein involved in Fe transport